MSDVDDMIRAIRADYLSTSQWTQRREPAEAVVAAMRRVPRDRFVGPGERSRAWDNTALPIGHGQTISQPFVVALMTDLVGAGPGTKVLEIGTGCGYQTAVLAELGAAVFSIEIVEVLAREAAARLEGLGYGDRVEVRHGDGGDGWPEQAPFDGILATAAAKHPPQAWLDQLAHGGRMIAPVGTSPDAQALRLWTKDPAGTLSEEVVLPVRFVPLTGPSGAG